MNHLDLFDPPQKPKYPNVPGFKARETSATAASQIAEDARALRLRCLLVLRDRPSTADEVAGILGRSILSVRPRLSELVARGYIEDTGERRRNESGKRAIVCKRHRDYE